MAKDLIGKKAPDFEIQLVDGSTRALSEFLEVGFFCILFARLYIQTFASWHCNRRKS